MQLCQGTQPLSAPRRGQIGPSHRPPGTGPAYVLSLSPKQRAPAPPPPTRTQGFPVPLKPEWRHWSPAVYPASAGPVGWGPAGVVTGPCTPAVLPQAHSLPGRGTGTCCPGAAQAGHLGWQHLLMTIPQPQPGQHTGLCPLQMLQGGGGQGKALELQLCPLHQPMSGGVTCPDRCR